MSANETYKKRSLTLIDMIEFKQKKEQVELEKKKKEDARILAIILDKARRLNW